MVSQIEIPVKPVILAPLEGSIYRSSEIVLEGFPTSNLLVLSFNIMIVILLLLLLLSRFFSCIVDYSNESY
jgi:hypothetical protein